MGFIKNLKEKFKTNKSDPIKSDESFVRSSMIWNTPEHIIILVTCTEDYAVDLCEFIEACNNIYGISVRLVQSGFEEVTASKDTKGDAVYIYHKRMHLAIAGVPGLIGDIACNIMNLSNSVLTTVMDTIYNNCDPNIVSKYSDLTIFDPYNKRNHECKYDKNLTVPSEVCKEYGVNTVEYTNVDAVLSRLPKGFNGRYILGLIKVVVDEHLPITVSDMMIYVYHSTEYDEEEFRKVFTESFVINVLGDLLSAILNKDACTVDDLHDLEAPLYMYEDGDSMPGNISDEHLDEIFREQYEKLNILPDDQVEYKDIDEELGPDEETENMREEDIIKDDTE